MVEISVPMLACLYYIISALLCKAKRAGSGVKGLFLGSCTPACWYPQELSWAPACTTYWSCECCLLVARAWGKLNIQIPPETTQEFGLCYSRRSFCLCHFLVISCFNSNVLSGGMASVPPAPGVKCHHSQMSLWSLHSAVQSLTGLAGGFQSLEQSRHKTDLK